MKKIIAITALLFIMLSLQAQQNVGIGTVTPNSSAQLDISSTSKGLLMPRVTTSQRNAIVNPAAGLMVFDLDKTCFYFFDGLAWKPLLFADNNKVPPVAKEAVDGKAGNSFGQSVAIGVDMAVVGAPGDSVNNNENQGSAYIFVRINGVWIQHAKLVANDGAAGDFFGYSVAVSGDYVVVGACRDTVGSNAFQGSAYIFRTNGITWTQQAKLVAADGDEGDCFGFTVSIDEATVIIGAVYDDEGFEIDKGTAYIFTRTNNIWSQQAKLFASNGGVDCQFSVAVSLSGNTAVVGAVRTIGGHHGAAYFFLRTGTVWTQQAIVYSINPAANNAFGQAVSISGDIAIVSEKDYGNLTGQAFIFERTGTVWNRTATLNASFMETSDQFGFSVSISGDYAAVGCPGDKVLTVEGVVGSVYIFKKNGSDWSLIRKVEDPEGFAPGRLGTTVAIDGTAFNIIGGLPNNFVSDPKFKGKVLFLNVE